MKKFPWGAEYGFGHLNMKKCSQLLETHYSLKKLIVLLQNLHTHAFSKNFYISCVELEKELMV